jgi:hypothetical protein
MPAFEVYRKRKFCVVIVWVKKSPKCFLESAIYGMNIKKEGIEKRKMSKLELIQKLLRQERLIKFWSRFLFGLVLLTWLIFGICAFIKKKKKTI